MSWPDAVFFPHQVRIRDVTGGGGLGQTHAPPPGTQVKAEVRDEQQLVRDEQQLVRDAAGQEVVSSTQVTVPVDTAVRLGALVTVWEGTAHQREAEVLAIGRDVNPPPLHSFLTLSLK